MRTISVGSSANITGFLREYTDRNRSAMRITVDRFPIPARRKESAESPTVPAHRLFAERDRESSGSLPNFFSARLGRMSRTPLRIFPGNNPGKYPLGIGGVSAPGNPLSERIQSEAMKSEKQSIPRSGGTADCWKLPDDEGLPASECSPVFPVPAERDAPDWQIRFPDSDY